MQTYQPRYCAYCYHNNNTPEQQLAEDRIKYPAGRMAGFMRFIKKMSAEYKILADSDHILNHEDFTKFIWDQVI
jgi:hypothetical protein